jgi:hypothetical protein
MSLKISNSILRQIFALHSADISISFTECAKQINIKASTLSSWHRNIKSAKWKEGYCKTEDEQPLDKNLIEQFSSCFIFGGHANKILKKLVTPKCLHNKFCFAKQHKILRRLFKKYPNIDFWRHVDFGEPRDDILLFLGKGEETIKKKYLDFSASDDYTPFKYEYTESSTSKPTKPPKTIWDYYE